MLYTPIIRLRYYNSVRLCVVYRSPLSKRNGFSNTIFFDQWSAFLDDIIKDSIASQRYATPRDFAVNSVTLRKWRHLIKSVLNYDNEGSNYRDCTSVSGHDSKGSNDKGCTSGHIYPPPLTLTHPTGLVDL